MNEDPDNWEQVPDVMGHWCRHCQVYRTDLASSLCPCCKDEGVLCDKPASTDVHLTR